MNSCKLNRFLFYKLATAFVFFQFISSILISVLYEKLLYDSGEIKVTDFTRLQKELMSQIDHRERVIEKSCQIPDPSKHNERSFATSDKEVSKLSQLFYPCNITEESLLAISGAETFSCKQLIVNIICAMQKNDLVVKYLGCFQDSRDQRLLDQHYQNLSTENSQILCVNRCQKLNFAYAGTENGLECFCGNARPSQRSHLLETECNLKCPANPSANCGGFLSINVFETGITAKN